MGHLRDNGNVDRIACAWSINRIVHAADGSEDIDCAPEARGLAAIARRFALLHGTEDHRKIELEMPMCDALSAWCGQPGS